MTQHGEQAAVVRGLSKRFRRTMRSAATVALTAGLAFTVASASALPLGPAPHRACASLVASEACACTIAPLPCRAARPPHSPVVARYVSASASKNASSARALLGSGTLTAAFSRAAVPATTVGPTAAGCLLRQATRASRTRGQPDVG